MTARTDALAARGETTVTVACPNPGETPWMLHITLDMRKSDYASYSFHLRTREEALRQATVIRRMAALIADYRGPWYEDHAYELPDGHIFNDWFAFVRADIYRLDADDTRPDRA